MDGFETIWINGNKHLIGSALAADIAAERSRANAPEIERRLAEIERLAQSLVNALPDCVLDWAGTGEPVGWSNISTIKAHRDNLRAAIRAQAQQ